MFRFDCSNNNNKKTDALNQHFNPQKSKPLQKKFFEIVKLGKLGYIDFTTGGGGGGVLPVTGLNHLESTDF